jgi:RNA polymerase sigma-70 factor (ECF subfamily)
MASPSSAADALAAPALRPLSAPNVPEFKRIYDENLPFMWRAARHLGVAPSAIEDVLQEVFLIVHRRLGEFEGRSTMKTWMYGILLHVVRNHRRALRRRGAEPLASLDELAVARGAGPHEAAETSEAMRTVQALLEELDDPRREVFVLVELEELSVPAIAELLGENANTIYGRLRLARRDFEQALRRHQAREARRCP